MKRKLNKTELELTNKGIVKRKKEIKESNKAIKIHKKHQEYTKIKREYEDLLEPYNREVEDKNNKLKIKKFEENLELAKLDLKNLEDQVKNGIKVKEAVGVN